MLVAHGRLEVLSINSPSWLPHLPRLASILQILKLDLKFKDAADESDSDADEPVRKPLAAITISPSDISQMKSIVHLVIRTNSRITAAMCLAVRRLSIEGQLRRFIADAPFTTKAALAFTFDSVTPATGDSPAVVVHAETPCKLETLELRYDLDASSVRHIIAAAWPNLRSFRTELPIEDSVDLSWYNRPIADADDLLYDDPWYVRRW